jgi:hypothetical protein
MVMWLGACIAGCGGVCVCATAVRHYLDLCPRYLFGEEADGPDEEYTAAKRPPSAASDNRFSCLYLSSAGQKVTAADADRVVVEEEEEEWEAWPEEALGMAAAEDTSSRAAHQPLPSSDAAEILREGGEEAVQALVAAEGWRRQFGEIISDVLGIEAAVATAAAAATTPVEPNGRKGAGRGGGVSFPWHVLAARWLDGDTAEDAFLAALDTALREREAMPNQQHGLEPEPEPEPQVDEALFFGDGDDDDDDDGGGGGGEVVGGGGGNIDRGVVVAKEEEDWAVAVKQLIELGFTDGAAIADALTHTAGAVQPALELLVLWKGDDNPVKPASGAVAAVGGGQGEWRSWQREEVLHPPQPGEKKRAHY